MTDKPFDHYSDFYEFYDIYVGKWLDDLPFYLEYAEKAKTPIVEIGAGSGRLAIPLAKANKSVIAVDSSSRMLDILKSRLSQEPSDIQSRVQIVETDASALTLKSKYDLIIVSFFTFNYFLTPKIQKKALRAFYGHLNIEGRILIDVFIPLRRIAHCPKEPILKVDTIDATAKNKIRGWNVYSIDKKRQIEYRRHIFEIVKADGTVSKKEFVTKRRYSYQMELNALFLENGFVLEDVFTGYDKKEAVPDSEQLLYVLKK